MSGCKHDVRHLRWRALTEDQHRTGCFWVPVGTLLWFPALRGEEPDALWCAACRSFLPLSPAAPHTEQTRIELRAAEIAAPGHLELWLPEDIGLLGLDPSNIDDDAASESHWTAGYLARCIVEHDKEQP